MSLDSRIPPPLPPTPPGRGSSMPKVTFEGAQSWRESIGMFLTMCIGVALLISMTILLVYVWKDKQVYEELIDYLDKTISISKINYNPTLGLYQLSEKELEVLGEQRTYKNLLRCYLFSEVGVVLFIIIVSLLYFSADVGNGTKKIAYWMILLTGIVYAIVEVHVFTFALLPYSGNLPNATEKLLNHAIPHNPGGLQQMEQRLGCTFDHNLYAANKRRMNPMNTCDPQIEGSFLPTVLLIVLFALRLTPIVIAVMLLAKRTPLSEGIAQVVEKMRGNDKKRLYVKRQQRQTTFDVTSPSKATTFGVNNTPTRITSTPLPPVPSPGNLDHSICYNNAAFFATSGAQGYNISSSEISRIDTENLKSPMSNHLSGSIQSEV